MTLHLLRLAVGIRDMEHLQQVMLHRMPAIGLPPGSVYTTTRRLPKRAAELLDGGSLYWVVKGQIRVRQRFLAIDTVRDEQGQDAAQLVLAAEWVPTVPVTCRPFQGWRYFPVAAVPPDLVGDLGDAPVEMIAELRALGLL